jgi:hypothetical protein
MREAQFMAEPNHAGFHNELRLTARELTLRIMICPPGMICAAAHKGAGTVNSFAQICS